MNHTDTKYLRNHPTVRRILDESPHHPTETPVLEAAWLRKIALEAGANDVGCVGLERAEMASQRDDILQAFPYAKTLLSFVCRMNRENLRTPSRSIANLEFHQSADAVNQTGRRIVQTLERHGIRAAHTAVGFPMEADRWPARMWVISHKPVAEAAGLGRMGLHRNIIHPVFGSFILLGTVVLDARIDNDSRPIDYNPCLECKLCVGACPTGAIGMDGHFDFSACYTHNYREFMGGFSDWAETVAASTSASDYRKRSATPNRCPCGRASPSGRTTRLPIACRCARRGGRGAAIPGGPETLHRRSDAPAAGQIRNGVRDRRFRCGRSRPPPFSA